MSGLPNRVWEIGNLGVWRHAHFHLNVGRVPQIPPTCLYSLVEYNCICVKEFKKRAKFSVIPLTISSLKTAISSLCFAQGSLVAGESSSESCPVRSVKGG